MLALAGLRAQTDTIREPRLGISTGTSDGGISITQISPAGAASAAGARVGDRIVSIGDVTIFNDDSFETFRSRYVGTTLTALPLVVRRGADTITLQLPVRIMPRVQGRVLPVPNASEKALRIRGGILKGSTS